MPVNEVRINHGAVAVAGSDQPGAGAGLRLSPRGMFCFMF